MPRFHLSPDKKEQLFHAELLKSGVEHQTAMRVAKLLASACPDTELSAEEQQLMTQACRQWLDWHKQRRKVSQVLTEITMNQSIQARSPLQSR